MNKKKKYKSITITVNETIFQNIIYLVEEGLYKSKSALIGNILNHEIPKIKLNHEFLTLMTKLSKQVLNEIHGKKEKKAIELLSENEIIIDGIKHIIKQQKEMI